MKQIVAHKKLSAMHGLLLVLALFVVLIVLNYVVLGFLSTYLGNGVSSLAFWVLGGLLAWLVLRVYIVQYSYELGDEVLRLNRAYGKRERHIEDIYLNQLLFVGAPEEARRRWPNARRVKATHVKGENPVVALVYQTSEGKHLALMQPNDDLLKALRESVKKK